ncbi:11493_t:CDS:2 [Entrophospora sp. SA101]|nr:11493_t:CDS:2 [Entrophospora sp. SA101]
MAVHYNEERDQLSSFFSSSIGNILLVRIHQVIGKRYVLSLDSKEQWLWWL